MCRYGGEEFVILMPNTHIQGAAHVAHQLSIAISSKPILTPRGNIGVTISQGVACVSHQTDFEETKLLSLADKALYQAKSLGRDRFELATLKPCIVKEQA
ncbi:GGDEF domain-containing protein [Shewanella psychropiezotolerans]|nr:GGDEF domain-containing protein [Shewanella psychropiezotolerans]